MQVPNLYQKISKDIVNNFFHAGFAANFYFAPVPLFHSNTRVFFLHCSIQTINICVILPGLFAVKVNITNSNFLRKKKKLTL